MKYLFCTLLVGLALFSFAEPARSAQSPDEISAFQSVPDLPDASLASFDLKHDYQLRITAEVRAPEAPVTDGITSLPYLYEAAPAYHLLNERRREDLGRHGPPVASFHAPFWRISSLNQVLRNRGT